MTASTPPHPRHAWLEPFGSAPFVRALGIAILGCGTLSYLLQQLIGWPGYLAVLVGLVVLAGIATAARQEVLRGSIVVPTSLVLFITVAGASTLWSYYQYATVGGVAYLVAYALLGTWLALNRDVVQLMRMTADVLRVVITAGLAAEVLVGILLDTSAPLIGIEGTLAAQGPISGLQGSDVTFGMLAVLAGVAFAIELMTRSVRWGVGVASLAIASLSVVFSGSAIVLALAATTIVAAGVLVGLRRLPVAARAGATIGVLGAATVIGGITWTLRVLGGTYSAGAAELNDRVTVWRQLSDLVPDTTVLGWGWLGPWRDELNPYLSIYQPRYAVGESAASAYVDVWFQLGLGGLAAFLVLTLLALGRSWLLATRQSSIVYLWPALTLTLLVVAGTVSSAPLTEICWLLLVVCAVTAARRLSWRTAFQPVPAPALG